MKKDKKNTKSFYWFLGVSALSVVLLLVCQFLFKDVPLDDNRFYENTKINGINVSNMTKQQAKNVIVSDPYKGEIVNYSLQQFEKMYNLFGKRAIYYAK